MIAIILTGFLIGILVSAPMGPVGMLCIQRTLYKGRWHGFVTGLGATLSDVIYAALTVTGMGFVIPFVEDNQAPLQLIGSLVIGVFGYYIYRSNPVKGLKKRKEKKLSYTQDFVTAFLLTFSNILIVLLYIGLFARFHFVHAEHAVWQLLIGLLSVGLGAIAWWLGITYLIAKLKKWFNIRGIWMLNRAVGSVIILLSLLGVLSVLFGSIAY